MNKIIEEIGKKLRSIRDFRGLSQENVAEELNISPHTYAKYEKGVSDPGIGLLYECARIFKVPVSQFFNFDDQSFFNSFNQNAIHYHQKDAAHHHNMVYVPMDAKERDLYKRWIADLKVEIARLREENKRG